jgi:tetratricopeptide (TPR) repeat protein
VIRFRITALFAASAIAAIAAGIPYSAGAQARRGAPTPSPAPAATATPTPETLDHAIPRLEAAIKTNPNDKDSMTELATDYLQANRPDLAAQLTQKLFQGGNKSAQIYFIDGMAQSQVGKADEGIASMEQAANLEPTNIQVLQALTQMYMRANRPADAERVAKRALTFNANSKDAAENYGFVLAVEKKFDEARAQFENSSKIDPKDPHPLVLEAQTYEDANSLPLAMPLLDRALAIDPKNLEALGSKAELASAQHDVKTSIATYQLILAQMTDNVQKASVTAQMALVYAREKQDTDADATYRKAIDDYGNLPGAHLAYGDYLQAKNDKAGALREWTTAVGANRDNPEALARLGQTAAEGNDFTKAVDNYKRLTEVDANDPRAYLLLGQAYMGAKNWNAARDAFKAAFNLAKSADALVGLAAADQQARNFAEAIEIYESLDKNAADLVKANPGMLYAMGNAYKGANQPQKAKATFVRFLAFLKPGTQGYTEIQQLIAQIDHPGATATAKPAPKPSAKPAATASPAPKK